MFNRNIATTLAVSLLSLALAACSNDDSQGNPLQPGGPITTHSIGGTVSGLTGSLTLQNSNGTTVTVAANGNFTFAAEVAEGASYNVTVAIPPNSQTCTVANGSGTALGDITNIAVTCAANPNQIHVTVTGLGAGKSVVLRAVADFTSSDLTATANGAFNFPAGFITGAEYEVFVMTQPPGQTCSIANPHGDIDPVIITNIAVVCINSSASARDWQPAESIATDDDPQDLDTVGQPQLGFDAAGNALAVWVSSRPTDLGNDLSFSRRASNGAWSTPVVLPRFHEPVLGGSLIESRREPRLAVAPNGNAVVVWRALESIISWHVGVSFYDAANNTWSEPAFAFTAGLDDVDGADYLNVSIDATGNSLVVFEHGGLIRFNRYSPGSGWVFGPTVTQLVRPIDSGVYAREPVLATHPDGGAAVIWRERTFFEGSINYFLYSSRYDSGANTWSAPLAVDKERFDPDARRVFSRYNLVIDATGVATAIWTRFDDQLHILSNRLTGNTWAAPVIVETGATGELANAYEPRAAIDAAGNIMAFWIQNDVDEGHYVANRYVPGTGWGTQQNIGPYSAVGFGAENTEMELAGNANGDVVALWSLYSDILPENQLAPYAVFANEYNGTTHLWGAPDRIDKEEDQEDLGDATDIAVAVDAQGNAVAAWKDLGPSESGIRSSRFE